MATASSPLAELADTAAAVGATRSKNEKRDRLATFLRSLPADDLVAAATFFSGRPLVDPTARLGMGWVQQGAALAAATGADEEQLRAAYLRHSDFGDAAAELVGHRAPTPHGLTIAEVAAGFADIAAAGKGEDRVRLLTGLLIRASAEEARFIGRVLSREPRIGLREGLLEEAVAAAFDAELVEVRRAHMLTGEIGETAVLARDGRLGGAAFHVGRPIRFMLASPVADAAEVMRHVGDEAWIEDKYDGIRAQLHIDDEGAVRVFSHDLNDVTRSFPEVVGAAAELRAEAPLVIDGELVPWREGSVLDFAALQTRLGRVRPSKELLADVPVVLVAFDLLHHRGTDLLETPSASDGRGSTRSGCPSGPVSGSSDRTSPRRERSTRSNAPSTTRASVATRG